MKSTIFKSKHIFYPLLKIEDKKELIEKLIQFIDEKQNAMLVLKDNAILSGSPYSFLIENDNLYVLFKNSFTQILSHINLEVIVKVGADNLNEDYKNLEKKELIFHTKLISEKPKDSNSGWKHYWCEFNKHSSYRVGDRTQYWNNVKNIKFDLENHPNIKCDIELVSRFGRSKELIINLLVIHPEGFDEKANIFLETLKKYPTWNISTAKNRIKIELAKLDLTLAKNTLIDPRKVPSIPSHFNWFVKNLKEIENHFKNNLK